MSLRIGDQVVGGSEKAGDPTADLQDRGGSPNADAGAHSVFPDAAGHHAGWRWFYDCGGADCARGVYLGRERLPYINTRASKQRRLKKLSS